MGQYNLNVKALLLRAIVVIKALRYYVCVARHILCHILHSAMQCLCWVTQGTPCGSGIVGCYLISICLETQSNKDIMQTMKGNLNAETI